MAVCLCVYVTNELSFRYFYCNAERERVRRRNAGNALQDSHVNAEESREQRRAQWGRRVTLRALASSFP
jgi:hypothetical protein